MTQETRQHLCINAKIIIGFTEESKTIYAKIKNQYVIMKQPLIFKKNFVDKVSNINDLIFSEQVKDPNVDDFEIVLPMNTKIILVENELELQMTSNTEVLLVDGSFDTSSMKLYNYDGTLYKCNENVLQVINPYDEYTKLGLTCKKKTSRSKIVKIGKFYFIYGPNNIVYNCDYTLYIDCEDNIVVKKIDNFEKSYITFEKFITKFCYNDEKMSHIIKIGKSFGFVLINKHMDYYLYLDANKKIIIDPKISDKCDFEFFCRKMFEKIF